MSPRYVASSLLPAPARDDGSTRWRTFVRVCPACLHTCVEYLHLFSRIFTCGRRRFIPPPPHPPPGFTPFDTRGGNGERDNLPRGSADRSAQWLAKTRSRGRECSSKRSRGGEKGVVSTKFRSHVFVRRFVDHSMIANRSFSRKVEERTEWTRESDTGASHPE